MIHLLNNFWRAAGDTPARAPETSFGDTRVTENVEK
jgi:hypothetical protein